MSAVCACVQEQMRREREGGGRSLLQIAPRVCAWTPRLVSGACVCVRRGSCVWAGERESDGRRRRRGRAAAAGGAADTRAVCLPLMLLLCCSMYCCCCCLRVHAPPHHARTRADRQPQPNTALLPPPPLLAQPPWVASWPARSSSTSCVCSTRTVGPCPPPRCLPTPTAPCGAPRAPRPPHPPAHATPPAQRSRRQAQGDVRDDRHPRHRSPLLQHRVQEGRGGHEQARRCVRVRVREAAGVRVQGVDRVACRGGGGGERAGIESAACMHAGVHAPACTPSRSKLARAPHPMAYTRSGTRHAVVGLQQTSTPVAAAAPCMYAARPTSRQRRPWTGGAVGMRKQCQQLVPAAARARGMRLNRGSLPLRLPRMNARMRRRVLS